MSAISIENSTNNGMKILSDRSEMFIDIHAHTYINSGPRYISGREFLTLPDELLKIYDKLEVERAVILPIVSPECSYITQSNEEILELSRRNSRFIPFCNIDPRAVSNSPDADLGYLLRHYKDEGCKGIGEVMANLHFLDPKVQNLFKHVEATGFPLTFHIAPTDKGKFYGLVDEPGLPGLELSLQRFPNLKFFAHSQTFWAEIAPLQTVGDRNGYPDYPVNEEGVVPKLMRKYSNLYGDLSAGSGYNALARDEEYAVNFLNEFQDRLLFGMDICCPPVELPKLPAFLRKLKEKNSISETVFSKIAKKNAINILDLG
jgi:predicted TIM-barrel fold metal-dependent hydrolase